VTVDPRVVLLIDLGAVFARAQEYFRTAGMHLRILGHIIDTSLVNSPAVVPLIVLRYLRECQGNCIGILYDVLHAAVVLQELLYSGLD